MAAQSLDDEFTKYWTLLTIVQKESLLSIAKNYVQLREEDSVANILKRILEERDAYLKCEGKLYTWQQVKEMALNKEQRHEL